jgi:glycosyltransferase involved in cell wall biosynthesis
MCCRRAECWRLRHWHTTRGASDSFIPLADRRVIRDAARLHATSQLEFDQLTRLTSPDRVVFVPNGVELPRVGATGERVARERFKLPARSPLVLFLGRIHPIKRLDLLAGAFGRVLQQHADAQLVIRGS